MKSKIEKNSAFKNVMSLAAIIVIITGVMASVDIVIPILLALFLSIICTQPILFLDRKKVPYTLAVLIVLTCLAIVLILLSGIVGNSISSFIVDLPIYEEKLSKMFADLIANINKSGGNINSEQLSNLLDPAQILSYTAVAAGEIGKVLSDSFLIILLMIFMLLEVKILNLKTEMIEKIFGNSLEYLNTIVVSIRHYLSIKTYISMITGILIWLWLYVMGIEYAVLWGLLAFLLNYIPTIGSILAAVPTILFALVQQGIEGMLWVGVGYFIIEMVMGNVVEPKVMGRGLGLSTFVVFLGLIIWGFILGTVGMFLSIPLTITIKIILEQNKKTKWIAVMLGTEKETKEML